MSSTPYAETPITNGILEKVTAFVTRPAGLYRELLVFRHPTAGVQLPAGTVELGEPSEEAVLREVAEETGLTEVVLIAKLGVLLDPLEPDERGVLFPIALRSAPAPEAPVIPFEVREGVTGQAMGRGAWVRLREEAGTFSRVAVNYYRLEGKTFVVAHSTEGWVPSAALTARAERHLYHLHLVSPAPDRWTQPADDGYDFALYWTPLHKATDLVDRQARWLAHVLDALQKD